VLVLPASGSSVESRGSIVSKAAVSGLASGVYLALLGAWLLFFPASFCGIFGCCSDRLLDQACRRPDRDHWVPLPAGRRGECRPFFRWTVEVRPVVLIVTIAFVLLGFSPPILILFGAIDAIGAAWMWWSLKSDA
jgi:hypothetical protein